MVTEFQPVATLADIPNGGMRQFVVKGDVIGIYRVGRDVYAIGDYCSHEETFLTDGEFEPDELEVECPLHGSRFNVETGEVRILPATRPVPAYHVRVDGDLVLVGPRKE
jgi:3-phenylpropionate/trans-cinnamate dioxygenase ferredoxin subunit